jgi:hypothetical protein
MAVRNGTLHHRLKVEPSMGDIHKDLAAIPAKQRAREMILWMRVGWLLLKSPNLASDAMVKGSTGVPRHTLAPASPTAPPIDSQPPPAAIDLDELGLDDLESFGGRAHPT